MKLSEFTEAYNNASEEERQEFLETIIPDILKSPKFQTNPGYREEVKEIIKETYNEPAFKTNVEYALLDSESKLLPRLNSVEIITGLKEDLYSDFEEPTIPEKINKLAERIESSPLEALGDSKETLIPETKMEKTFVKFIDFVLAQPVRDGKKLITNNLIHQFRKNLPDDIKPKTVNPRQWKKELFEYTRQKTDVAKPDKTSKGDNRGIRLVFPRNFNIGMLKCKLPVS